MGNKEGERVGHTLLAVQPRKGTAAEVAIK